MRYRAVRVARMGLLFALSIALSFLEAQVSGLVPVPGIKIGLSNIATMYCLFCLGKREAYLLAGLKGFFTLLVRGAVGAAMSFFGGITAVTAMLLLKKAGKGNFSYGFLSIAGGVFHNIGQLVVASLVLKSSSVFYYLPILMISGVAMGCLTGFLLQRLMPRFKRIFF